MSDQDKFDKDRTRKSATFIDIGEYRIKLVNILKWDSNTNLIDFKITDRTKGVIGHGCFANDLTNNTITPGDIFINDKYKRKGLGTALYVFAEQISSAVMIPSDRQSDEAVMFWSQKNRPFGKNS